MISAAIYWLAIRCYAAILHIAALFHPKAKLFIAGRKQLLTRMRQALATEQRPRIWMHCASLGEFEQGRPVLENLRKKYPSYALVLTFFSPSGYEVRKNYEGADYIFYLPFDSNTNAKEFLDIVQPQLCIFVKYELWYFFLHNIAKRHIPALLISANFRTEQAFFKWHGGLQRCMLQSFTHIFVQNKKSVDLLQGISIKNVSISGDTRFDRVIEAVQQKKELPAAASFAEGYKVIVAGSTWKEDEEFLQKALQQLPDDWKLILVPHEVHDSHINEIGKLFSDACVRWSQYNNERDKRVLIVDKIGLLLQLYQYANVAWIGGGFGKAGVHNILEAAAYGIPCAYGPIFHQFNEGGELIDAGGAITTNNPAAFALQIQEWQKDTTSYRKSADTASNYIFTHGGATEMVMAYIVEKNLLSRL